MSATEAPVGVVRALALVKAELPSIGKGDKSPEGYSYRGVEAITRQLQPLLAKHGVIITPKAEVLATVPSPAMKDGWQDVLMRVDWTIYGPDGSHIEATTNGIGRDRSDKGANKAQTQAYKYLLLHLLCIADAKDDADGQTYEHDRADRLVLKPGEMTAADAKSTLLSVAEGDKELAKAAWEAAGLDGHHKVTEDQLQAAKGHLHAIYQAATGEGSEPSSSSSELEPVGAATQLRTQAEEIAAAAPEVTT